MNIHITQFSRNEENPGFLLWQLSNQWQRQLCKALEPVELTHVQYLVLAAVYWLGRDGKPNTQIKIARQAQTDIMMTSKVLRALEEKECITRPSNPDDARERLVRITDAGLEKLEKAQVIINKFEYKFFNSILMARQGFNGYLKEIIKSNEEK